MVRNKIKRNCLNCGKEFETIPSQIKVGKGKFCSRFCRDEINRHLPRSEKLITQAKINVLKAHEARRGQSSWNKKDKIILVCQFCGNFYEAFPYLKNKRRFCSRECSHKFKTTIRGTSHPLWKRQLRGCEWCGKEVWVKPAKLQEFRFCSRQCLGAWTTSNCQSPTNPELIVKDALEKLGIPFGTEYRIGKYACDFVLPQYHIVVEVDGDYWHSLPKRKRLDKIKDTFLQSEGWEVIRLKEMDIYHNLSKCLVKISKHISLFPT